MMKKVRVLLVIISMFCILTEGVYALGMKKYDTTTEQQEICATKDACKTSTSLLGDVNCECSVAWLLQKILNYIRIIGPTLAILLGSIDYIKAIISSDAENMKKTNQRFLYRLIAAIALFLIPTIVEVLLGLFGITSDIATGGLV